jgi:Coenzyme PQQ synthesis protein D (PqqD)
MDRGTVVGRRDRVMSQQVEGDAVLLDVDSGEYFALDDVGSLVWELCDGSRSVADMAELISAEFDVDASTALVDAIELLESLAGAGLVVER